MLTLYTAVGTCKLHKNSNGETYPVILLGKRTLLLDPYEMLLWSSLSSNILTHQEARAQFYEKEQEMHLLSDLDYEHYLKRLLFRGLVASGTGYTGINALHELLEPLQIRSASVSPFAKLAAVAEMVLINHCPAKTAFRIFQKDKLTRAEKQLLPSSKAGLTPVAGLLEHYKDYDRNEVIGTLANLYLKRQIAFDTP